MFEDLLAGSRHLYRKGPSFAIPMTRQALRLLSSWPAHLSVVRALSHPQCKSLVRQHPLLVYKYLGDYALLRLPMKARRSVFLSQFRFLQQAFSVTFLDSVHSQAPTLWRRCIKGEVFEVAIELLGVLSREGELRLVFRTMGDEVYRLIFVFAAGRDFNLPDEPIIVITAVQGGPDFKRVKAATKACDDIQPARILMAALEGIAQACHISTILGPHDTRQLNYCEKSLFFYGAFFGTYGGKEIPAEEMYLIRVPYYMKPPLEVKATHRRRNRRKRLVRAEVSRQAAQAISQYLKAGG